MESIVRLENWSLTVSDFNPCSAPESVTPKLSGNCYGHPDHADGRYITTSRVTGYQRDGEDLLIRTCNRLYRLGQVDAQYELAFPNARQRVFNQLKTTCQNSA